MLFLYLIPLLANATKKKSSYFKENGFTKVTATLGGQGKNWLKSSLTYKWDVMYGDRQLSLLPLNHDQTIATKGDRRTLRSQMFHGKYAGGKRAGTLKRKYGKAVDLKLLLVGHDGRNWWKKPITAADKRKGSAQREGSERPVWYTRTNVRDAPMTLCINVPGCKEIKSIFKKPAANRIPKGERKRNTFFKDHAKAYMLVKREMAWTFKKAGLITEDASVREDIPDEPTEFKEFNKILTDYETDYDSSPAASSSSEEEETPKKDMPTIKIPEEDMTLRRVRSLTPRSPTPKSSTPRSPEGPAPARTPSTPGSPASNRSLRPTDVLPSVVSRRQVTRKPLEPTREGLFRPQKPYKRRPRQEFERSVFNLAPLSKRRDNNQGPKPKIRTRRAGTPLTDSDEASLICKGMSFEEFMGRLEEFHREVKACSREVGFKTQITGGDVGPLSWAKASWNKELFDFYLLKL